MNGHDPLCRAYYQANMSPDICRSCDLILAVRLDERKILNSRVMYQSGYTDGYSDGVNSDR